MKHLFKSIAQSTLDYLILTGIIIVVVIPLLTISSNRIDIAREAQITEAVKVIQFAVAELINLGYGSATERVVQIPSGIDSSIIQNNILILRFKNRDLVFDFGYNVAGSFPINEGRHYIKLFNNGTHIVLSSCGNVIIEPPEECDCPDPSNPSACALPTPPPGGFNPPPGVPVCYPPNHQYACRLSCVTSTNCPGGFVCYNNACIPYSECGNNLLEGFEQCDPPTGSSTSSQCSSYVGVGICDTNCMCQASCGNGVINLPGEVCDPGNPPLGIPTQLGSCTATQGCTSSCQCGGPPPPPPSCGNGIPEPGEQCGEPGLSCQVGYTCNTQTCMCEVSPPPPACPASLTSYYDFEISSNLGNDLTGNNPGTVSGSVSSTSSGIVGRSARFSNPSSLGHIESNLDLPTKGTLEFMFQAYSWTSSASLIQDVIISAGSSYCHTYRTHPSWNLGKIQTEMANPATLLSSTIPSTNTNYHIAITWDTNVPESKIYVNGNLEGTATNAYDCFSPFYIGRNPTANPFYEGFNGLIDEVLIFNDVLDVATISQHAQTGLSGQPICSFTPSCSSTFPTCGGSCPSGQSCTDIGGACGCITTPQPCGSTYPACNGVCSGGQTCANIGGSCQCTTAAICGDGQITPPEQCDPYAPSSIPNHGCASGLTCVPVGLPNECTCSSLSTCGNGITEPSNGEQCDDGNILNNDFCNNLCQWTYCGDNLVQFPDGYGLFEQCDDGQFFNFPGGGPTCPSGPMSCSNNCQILCGGGSSPVFPLCGNSVINIGEQCDPPGTFCSIAGITGTCSNQCMCIVQFNFPPPWSPAPSGPPPPPPPAPGVPGAVGPGGGTGSSCQATGGPGSVPPNPPSNPYGVICSGTCPNPLYPSCLPASGTSQLCLCQQSSSTGGTGGTGGIE